MADFSPAALAQSVHQTIDEAQAAIPEGHHTAVLIDGRASRADGVALRAIVVHRSDSGWAAAAEADYDGPHGIVGKIAVAKSW